jgi:MFS family permease
MRKRHAVLGFLGAVSIITFVDRLAIAVTGPRIQADLNLGPELWGWVLSAYVIANGIFEIPSGAAGDRRGYRRELFRISIWWSTFTALTAACTTFWQMVSVRFLFGLGTAGAYPNAAGVVSRWFPLGERARAQGFVWAASRLGGALAPLLLVPFEEAFGWRAMFIVLGGIGFAWAFAWWIWYRDRPADQPGITQAELSEIGEQIGPTHSRATPWRELFSLPQMWAIFFAYGFYAWGSWFYFSWFPTWLVHAGHFSMREMSVYAALPFLLGMVSNVAGGALSDRLAIRIGPKRAYNWVTGSCLAVTAVLLALMSFAQDRVAFVVLSSVSLCVMDLMLPSAWAMCMAIGGRHGGAATGMMNTAGQIGGLVCTAAFGTIVAQTGDYNIPVRIIAAMVMLAAIIFAMIDSRKGFQDTSTAT